MLHTRLVTGATLIALLAGLLWLDARWQDLPVEAWPGGTLPGGLLLGTFAMLLLVPALTLELSRLLRAGGVAAWPVAAALPVALAAFASVALASWHLTVAARGAALVAALGLLPALVALTRADSAKALAETGRWLLLAGWIGALPACWIALRAEAPWWALAGAVLVVKVNDMGAYFTGMALGRHRMVPWISPKKTWEGFLGGAACSVAAGTWLGERMGVGGLRGALFGLLASLLGPIGDLAESILKRQAGAKDSGATVPGMGGAMDVLDSLLLTAPAAWWLLGSHGAR
jgi:phosphatidate cytidylyltransferase